MKTFKYRIYPRRAQEKRLFQMLAVCRNWYNMCIEERKVAWESEGRSISRYDQCKTAILYRRTFPQAAAVSSATLRAVAADVDLAFKAFFRRVRAGEKPGYPRFKGAKYFNSFGFSQADGFKLDGHRLYVFGVGRIPVRLHRPTQGKIKTCRIIYEAGRWFACLVCDTPAAPELPKTGRSIGIDVGLTALITTSDGLKVDPPQYYREGERRLRVLQRSLARKKKGGRNRRKALRQVQRQHVHVRSQRTDYAHKLSYALVQNHDRIACEDLAIRNMARNPHLSKSILDAGWGVFRQFLTYKAASAGRETVFVDPAYTSARCSNCGEPFADFNLSTRWVECDCGLSLDRDHNAALNILKRAGWGS